MKRIILVQFFPARKMRIFSESVCAILSPFWTQFWYQTQVFGPIFNKKWKLGTGFKYKVDEMKPTSTVFQFEKDENTFKIYFEPIWDQFWYQKQAFGPIFNEKGKLGTGF